MKGPDIEVNITQLAEINKKLNQGDPENPARIETTGEIVVTLEKNVSSKEKEQLVSLIGDWDFKRVMEIRGGLIHRRNQLEKRMGIKREED